MAIKSIIAKEGRMRNQYLGRINKESYMAGTNSKRWKQLRDWWAGIDYGPSDEWGFKKGDEAELCAKDLESLARTPDGKPFKLEGGRVGED